MELRPIPDRSWIYPELFLDLSQIVLGFIPNHLWIYPESFLDLSWIALGFIPNHYGIYPELFLDLSQTVPGFIRGWGFSPKGPGVGQGLVASPGASQLELDPRGEQKFLKNPKSSRKNTARAGQGPEEPFPDIPEPFPGIPEIWGCHSWISMEFLAAIPNPATAAPSWQRFHPRAPLGTRKC